MKLSLDIILENLSEYGARASISSGMKYEFSYAQMLTPGSEDLSEDVLYVCEPKILQKLNKRLLGNHCFLLSPSSDNVSSKHIIDYIILDTSSSLPDVINHLIKLFERLNSFELKVKNATLLRKGCEPFLEIAENEFPHCLILLTDPAYNIVCSSKKSIEQNEYLNAMLLRGYYNKNDLVLMAKHGYLDDERKYSHPVLYSASDTICGLHFLVRSYKANGAAVSFMGCYFIDKQPTLEDIVLFDCLSAEVDNYYKFTGYYEGLMPNYQQLIDDLIANKQNDSEFYRDRCFRLHLPLQGDFRLGIIKLELSNNIKTSQIVNQLKVFCSVSNYGVFQYGLSVIVLFRDWHCYETKDAILFEENWLSFLNILESNQAYIGISLSFNSIDKFHVAYKQALNAAEIGHEQNPEKNTYFYSEYYLEDILKKYSEVFDLNEVYVHYLDKLAEENNSISNMELLYHYLCSERNISQTAKTVHMHRNSVIYRIQKIQEILNLNLDDPAVRLRILISFKILKMQKKIPDFEIKPESPFLSIE